MIFPQVVHQPSVENDFGVDVLYKCGGKLVGERKRRSYKERVTELQFSGDLATIETRESCMHTTRLA